MLELVELTVRNEPQNSIHRERHNINGLLREFLLMDFQQRQFIVTSSAIQTTKLEVESMKSCQ